MLVCHNQSSKRTFRRLKVGRHTESSEWWGEDIQTTWAKYADDTTWASEWLINVLLCPKKSAAKLLECSPPCAAGDKDGCLLSAPWRKWAAIFAECTRGSLLRQPTATEYCCQTTRAVKSVSPSMVGLGKLHPVGHMLSVELKSGLLNLKKLYWK